MTTLLSALQTSTALGTIDADEDTTSVAVGGPALERAHPVVVIVATGVTSGATLALMATNTKLNPAVATTARELVRVAISASGTTVIPLAFLADKTAGPLPDGLYLTSPSYTDGTYVATIKTHA